MRKSLFVEEQASLTRYHTYGIEAKAKFLIEITSEEDLKEAFSFIDKEGCPYIILGRGSNVLIKDDYFDGLVLVNKLTYFEVDGTRVKAQSGVNLPLISRKISKLNLSGFEKLVGVPGTIGGAICMNAGIGEWEMCDFVTSVTTIDREGKRRIYQRDECGFKYRASDFLDKEEFILEAEFELEEKENVFPEVQLHLKKRLETQPIEERNSGCIFKNPEGYSAGALIDQCGLKGLRVGGAEVSHKHANFINNVGSASFNDVMALISQVQKAVKEQKGVELSYEVRIL